MNEKDIYIKILEYGELHKNGFKFNTIVNDLKNLEIWEKTLIQQYVDNAYYNKTTVGAPGYSEKETLFLCININSSFLDSEYIINLDSRFKYLDYKELQQAQENAKTARTYSVIAIILSLLSILIALLIPVLLEQTVKINNHQFGYIEEMITKNKK